MNIDWQLVQTVSVLITTVAIVVRLLMEIKQHFFEKLTKEKVLLNFLSSESVSVKEFFTNMRKELYPKGVWIIISILFGLFITPAGLYLYLRNLIHTLALSPYLGLLFFLGAFDITIAIFIIIHKWPKPKLFRISKLISTIWGFYIFFLLILIIIANNYHTIPYLGQKLGEVIKDSQQYIMLASIVLVLSAVFWLLVELGYNNQAEKIIKREIMKNSIADLREKGVTIRLGTSGTIVEGLLWDFPEKGLILKDVGVIFVFWDDISWIEVIEKGSKKSEDPEESSREVILEEN
ncbi:MAG: hypothetical protein XD40_0845 [Archaeoglobus fulgidus]|uniref:Uncharacterized protein n=1 Tax=Archaeoglobus fulgidus TaxID=2234 RepID=A0A101E2M0_ARCFL|nr:hypothetical protein [Archaeoglobus fulgidus]KUJ93917.1 MAG: hypothetical protein XD40_0845 [Archaeoglobus fulgidus]KUK07456.1 MAG: hypothetical protein XD48_0352 [Archaeoglobus fulgidus]